MFWKQKYPVHRDKHKDSFDSSDDDERVVVEEQSAAAINNDMEEEEESSSVMNDDDVEESNGNGDANNEVDESYVDDDDDDDDDDKDSDYVPDDASSMDDHGSQIAPKTGCCSPECSRLISALLFVAGAALYIYSAYYAYDYFLLTEEIPTSDLSQQPVLFQANANSVDSKVTDYMAYTFASGLCFLLVGIWNLLLIAGSNNNNKSSSSSCYSRTLVYGSFSLAAIWSMSSSALLKKEPYMAEFFQLVAVHLYMLAAFGILCMSKGSVSTISSTSKCLFCCTPLRWLRLADSILILGTIGDVTLSYLNLWKEEVVENGPITQEQLLYAGMATAGCWGLCALIYVMVAICEVCCCANRSKRSSDDGDDEEESVEEDPEAYDYNDDHDSHEVYEDGDDDEESQESGRPLNKYLPQTLKQEHTEDTANDDDDASVTSFSSWWTAGPANKDGIARSSLDKIFGR